MFEYYIKLVYREYLLHPKTIFRNIKWRLFIKTISSGRYVFIIGAPRSGTTLLHSVISVHKECSTVQGETQFATGKNLLLEKKWNKWINKRTLDKIINESIDMISFFDNFVKEVNSSDKIFIEKTPHHLSHLKFLLKKFPQSMFIHIHRDARDAYASGRSQQLPQAKSAKLFAKSWKRWINYRLEFEGNSRIIDVSYEKFTENPKKEMIRVMKFIGLDFDPLQINKDVYSKDRRSKNKIFAKLNQEINTTSQERWKKELNENEVAIFRKYCSTELEKLGYIM